jgi:dTDP-4-amino-4,6-dideoxygalactose transaminase
MDLFTNGHMALEMTLQAMNLRGEVITTPFTFISTTHAIVRNGLEPVFCDIDPTAFTIDPARLEELITDRTTAIVPVHVYGNICRVEEIERIAEKYGLKVLYDAAHAFGCTYKGIGIGNFGDASCFSFHATKVFNTVEGGAVCCHSAEIQRRLCDLKNFGIHDEETVAYVGGNAKMNEFCAAMGLCNLRHLQEEIEKRRLVAQRYDERLGGVPGLQLNAHPAEIRPNYAYYPVVFDGFRLNRDEVFARLAENGIIPLKYFCPLTSAFACYAGKAGFDPAKTPVAAHVAERVLTLPMYADLPTETVDRICDLILQ